MWAKMWTFVSSDGNSELCFKEKQEPRCSGHCMRVSWLFLFCHNSTHHNTDTVSRRRFAAVRKLIILLFHKYETNDLMQRLRDQTDQPLFSHCVPGGLIAASLAGKIKWYDPLSQSDSVWMLHYLKPLPDIKKLLKYWVRLDRVPLNLSCALVL